VLIQVLFNLRWTDSVTRSDNDIVLVALESERSAGVFDTQIPTASPSIFELLLSGIRILPVVEQEYRIVARLECNLAQIVWGQPPREFVQSPT
jgi:hypothetical protein